jgi:uncharacterized protein YidB (DUF937 family)
MGLLDSVVGALAGGQGGGGNAALLNAVIGMLGSAGQQGGGGLGGLGGLMSKMQQSGLGDVMNSWVSTGQNMPISPDQLSSVLGNDALSGLAKQLGLGQGEVAGQLSQMLPQVVDKLTPNGQMPAGGDLGGMDIGSLLGGLLKR